MQHKIKYLDYLILYCDGDLKINILYDNKCTEDFISLVKSKNNLEEFIFDYESVKWNADKFDDLITNILELRANSITKLKYWVLRSNEGLKFEDIDLFTSFNNLKKLDLSFNDWSSEASYFTIISK
ncbi:unnamed protein product [Rhizophagus irregularis]|nr:unnamed protein product [Rhizophagus irregularis]